MSELICTNCKYNKPVIITNINVDKFESMNCNMILKKHSIVSTSNPSVCTDYSDRGFSFACNHN